MDPPLAHLTLNYPLLDEPIFSFLRITFINNTQTRLLKKNGGMAGRNRVTSRGPTVPAQEESQIWTETYNILKQLPDTHAKAQKVAFEANKNQRVLLGLGNGEGPLVERAVY